MGTAMQNLEWIDSISLAKTKFDKLEDEDKVGKFPTGVLKQDTEALEYCDSYEKVKLAHQNNTKVEL